MVREKFFLSILIIAFLFFSATLVIGKASNPEPYDGCANVSDPGMEILAVFWTRSGGIVSQNVYFGTNYRAVESADVLSDEFKISTPAPYYHINDHQTDTWYYWRVDDVYADSTVVKKEMSGVLKYSAEGRLCGINLTSCPVVLQKIHPIMVSMQQ